MRVCVIGGGAVGLCAAEALAARGCEVTVLERDRCGAGASAGNAGWITPSLATPVPGPGVIATSLRWLVDPSGPLWIRPSLSPALLDWIARFVLNCRGPAYARGVAALQLAAARAGRAFDALAERGVEFERHDEPLLFPAFDQAELDFLLHAVDELHGAGSSQPLEQGSADELRGLEPALGPDLVGGIIAHDEGRVRPEGLTAGVHRALIAQGVEVTEGIPVTRLIRDNGEWLAETPTGPHRAQAVVIAGGVDSARLLAAHGVRLPIAAAKGYSRTYARHPSGPQHPLYLEAPKVAVSVYDEGVRVSGTLELGAQNLSLSARRLNAITAAAQRALPGWQMPSHPRDWAGMRSLSPDGLPYIGAVPGFPGVHLATAHATLGITLAPLTGELLAAIL
ncbi:MAG TPA: FAD-dependent oxidoreductase, partial [Solirubrobacteraceae bacterium]|nr:FAD-dependent oxidoreductase [Solirubrobacteraceae bacterium]